jgi:predicted HicB family RNase H-like nuclease
MTTRKRPTLAELEANIEQEASWAEKNFGPHITGRLTKPGRPAKGTVIEPTRPHSLRVQDSIWQALSYKAQKAGLSVNQAAQLALLEWAKR